MKPPAALIVPLLLLPLVGRAETITGLPWSTNDQNRNKAPGAFICENIQTLQTLDSQERRYLAYIEQAQILGRQWQDSYELQYGKIRPPSPEDYGCLTLPAGQRLQVQSAAPYGGMFVVLSIQGERAVTMDWMVRVGRP